MRFAFYSVEGTSLCFWSRLQDEGHDVLVYIKNAPAKQNGDGIVNKTNNLQEWITWGLKDRNTVFIFDCTGAGSLADDLRRRGALVVGGGEFMDRLEGDRSWAERNAAALGIVVPKHEVFSDIPAALARARHLEGEWVFKTDKYLEASTTYLGESAEDMVRYLEGLQKRFGNGGKCLLQRKIPGIAISTAAWFNGKTFIGPFEGTIEHKKLMNDDIGPNTGCSFNALWMYEDEPRIAKALQWRALDAFFRHSEAPPGLYDINALIGEEDGEAYFLEFTPRFGYDSEPTAQKLLEGELGEFFYKLATSQLERAPFSTQGLAYGIRVSCPPYPYEWVEEKKGKRSCVGTPVLGADGVWSGMFMGYGVCEVGDELEVCDPSGLVGIVAARGRTVTALDRLCRDFLKDELQIPNRQYRTDGAEKVLDDAKRLAKLGFATPIKE